MQHGVAIAHEAGLLLHAQRGDIVRERAREDRIVRQGGKNDGTDAAVVDALADPAVRGKLTDLGFEIVPREQQTPEALGALHKAEIEKWWPIIEAAKASDGRAGPAEG